MGKSAVRPTSCVPSSKSNDLFVACAGANFGKDSNDEWSINQAKKIAHISAGE